MAVWDKELEECRKALADLKKFTSACGCGFPWTETPLEKAGVDLARAFDTFNQRYSLETERAELETQWEGMQK